jgi:membrane protease YdiL (CAAX protease family)
MAASCRSIPKTCAPGNAATARPALRTWHLQTPALTRDALLAISSLAAVALVEVITAFGDPRYGVAAHVALLAVFLSLSALSANRRRQAFFLVITIAPLIRIVSMGMPLTAFPRPLWYLVVSIPLFIAAFLIVRQLGLSRRSLRLQMPALRCLPIDLAVCASGIGLGYAQWLILRPTPLLPRYSVAWIIGAGLILLVSTGFIEELLFRGLIQHVAVNLFGPRAGILFSALLFAVLHTGYRSLAEVVFALGLGLYFGLVVWRTKSLLGVSMTHGTINIMLFIALPFTLHSATRLPAPVATSWGRPQATRAPALPTMPHLRPGATPIAASTATPTTIPPLLDILLNPDTVYFGKQDVSTTSTVRPVHVVNLSPESLTIAYVTIVGPHHGDFGETDTCTGAPIAMYRGCIIYVRFTPLTGGARSATVVIADNAAVGQHTVPLSGRGEHSKRRASPYAHAVSRHATSRSSSRRVKHARPAPDGLHGQEARRSEVSLCCRHSTNASEVRSAAAYAAYGR